ncbi:hypothetical protein CYMTET_26483, partial [Cymbomonas tetramitiformis]|eukprot:gene25523-31189_t
MAYLNAREQINERLNDRVLAEARDKLRARARERPISCGFRADPTLNFKSTVSTAKKEAPAAAPSKAPGADSKGAEVESKAMGKVASAVATNADMPSGNKTERAYPKHADPSNSDTMRKLRPKSASKAGTRQPRKESTLEAADLPKARATSTLGAEIREHERRVAALKRQDDKQRQQQQQLQQEAARAANPRRGAATHKETSKQGP